MEGRWAAVFLLNCFEWGDEWMDGWMSKKAMDISQLWGRNFLTNEESMKLKGNFCFNQTRKRIKFKWFA